MFPEKDNIVIMKKVKKIPTKAERIDTWIMILQSMDTQQKIEIVAKRIVDLEWKVHVDKK